MWKIILVTFFISSSALSNSKVVEIDKKLLQTMKSLSSQKDFSKAYDSVQELHSYVKSLLILKLDDDSYFKASNLATSLEISLSQKKLDVNGCYTAKIEHFKDFGVRSISGGVDPKDLPPMIKESYFILDKLCRLYQRQ